MDDMQIVVPWGVCAEASRAGSGLFASAKLPALAPRSARTLNNKLDELRRVRLKPSSRCRPKTNAAFRKSHAATLTGLNRLELERANRGHGRLRMLGR